MVSRRRVEPPNEVRAIRDELNRALNLPDSNGKPAGNTKYGIYAFYDYDGEPIYVGQTYEQLRVRIRRHLTNQRTDAVAMNVLDPFEVAEIEMWPFWELEDVGRNTAKGTLNSAEYTVFQQLMQKSAFKAVLNEVPVAPATIIELPESVRARIVPEQVFQRRIHPDIRIARRANTIARLAQVISERAVGPGLRQTLLTQARRLEHLAERRLGEGESPSATGEAGEMEKE